MVIDSHVHIGRLHDSPFEKMTLEQVRDALLHEMKSSGVDHALVLPKQGKKMASVDTKLDVILNLTEGIDQLSVIGTVNISEYQKKDLAKIEQLLKDKRIKGIKLYPGYEYFYPSDVRCIPVYKLCLKYGIPVIFHSGDTLSIPGKPAKIKYAHPLHIDDVATDFPNLTIIMAHLGNPWLVDAAEVIYKNANVYADVSGLVVGESLNSPYGKLMHSRISELILYAGGDKLLFGTDWPLTRLRNYIQFAKKLPLSKENKYRLFYKNAAQLFKLPV